MPASSLYYVPLSSLTVIEGLDGEGRSTGPLFPGDALLGEGGNPDAVRGDGQAARLTLTGAAETLRVRDDDDRFDGDIGRNIDTNSYFPWTNQTVVGGSAGVQPGSLVQVQYAYVVRGSDGSTLTIHAVSIRAPGDLEGDDNTISGIVATGFLDPDVTYRVTKVLGDPRPTYDSLVNCFTPGTMIATARGEVAVETLRPGDLVLTRDRGPQPVRWAAARHVEAAELALQPQLRPIRIRAGALGAGTPRADLVVSPQHRILVRSKIALRMFGAAEVLVAAKQLLCLEGIEVAADPESVTYVHFAFDRHEVVLSNGAETESLYPGAEALKAVGPAAREELLAIFPQLRTAGAVPPARVLAGGRQGRSLAQRHQRNARALVG